jgi:D-alanine-D-alanine ligase
MAQKAVILYGKLSAKPNNDELDVLEEVDLVKKTLISMGYETEEMVFDLDLYKIEQKLRESKPAFVYNLVETIDNCGEMHFVAPALLDFLKIPYTGVQSEQLAITTNKVLTKKILKSNNINTANWFMLDELELLDDNKTYIIKPVKEDGSLGITGASVFKGSERNRFANLKDEKHRFFIEEFLEGREFNISVLGGKDEPEVLPLAEMLYINFPENKPKIMGFEAKWEADSFEYNNTSRTYDYQFVNPGFEDEIKTLCTKCWNAFNLKGYIRIDIRLTRDNVPHVIEINGNPCISENGGFYAASQTAGYSFEEVMKRIVADSFK